MLNIRPLVLAAVLAFSACTQATKGAPAQLPPTCPLAQVGLPNDATQAEIHMFAPLGHGESEFFIDAAPVERNGLRAKEWVVGFRTGQSWQELKADLDQILAEQGFALTKEQDGNPNPEARIISRSREWVSKERNLEVVLWFQKDPKYKTHPAFEGYTLTVIKYEDPLSAKTK